MCELFPTGKNQDPSITLLSDERFALGKDEQTTFIDLEGNMNLVAVQWSEVPQAIAQDSPYLLAVLGKTVEIRTDEPRLHIQGRHIVTMPLTLICNCNHRLQRTEETFPKNTNFQSSKRLS